MTFSNSDISANDGLGRFDMMVSYGRMPTGSMRAADSSSRVYSHVRMDAMDKLVKRVTVIQGSGENRHANVVYKSEMTKMKTMISICPVRISSGSNRASDIC